MNKEKKNGKYNEEIDEMELFLMLPLYINSNVSCKELELKMAKECLKSLDLSEGIHLIVYNQGGLTNEEACVLLKEFDIPYDILGNGHNIGIVASRFCGAAGV